MSDKAVGAVPVQGLILSGMFFSIAPGEPYNDKNGERHQPYKLVLAVNGTPVSVEVDEDKATTIVAESKMGDPLSLQVYADGAYDRASGRRGLVYFRAR